MIECWSCADAAIVQAVAPMVRLEPAGKTRNLATIGPGSIRVVPVSGVLTPYGIDGEYRGGAGTAVADLIETVNRLTTDPNVGGVVFDFNSPGGSSTLIPEAVDAIRALSFEKPTLSLVQGGFCCSGAIFLAAGTRQIFATRGAVVGSIGTYIAVADTSKLAEKVGIQVHVIRSTPLKGLGVPGEPITDAFRAELQRFVDTINADFLEAISIGRRLKGDRLDAIATGQVWRGQKLVQLGLVDGIVPNPAAAYRRAGWASGPGSIMCDPPKVTKMTTHRLPDGKTQVSYS